MSFRPSRTASVIAGCAAIAGVAAAVPAMAAGDNGDQVAVAGSTPSWATPSARVGGVDGQTHRHIQVALALRDPQGAAALAHEVSTPGSAMFRKTLSREQFTARFGPTEASVDAVTSWLRDQGLRVTGVASSRQMIDAEAPVETLESAFGTSLQTFRTTVDGVTHSLVAPDRDILLPSRIRGAVTAVLGLDDSGQLMRPQHVSTPLPAATADDESCARSWGEVVNKSVPQRYAQQSNTICGYDTAQVRKIYGLGTGATGQGAKVGIVGAYGAGTVVSDTNRAAARFGGPPLRPGQFRAVDPPGGYVPRPECEPASWSGELALDTQMVHKNAPAADITYYGSPDCGHLLTTLATAVSDNKVDVISGSWGNPNGEATETPANLKLMDNIGVQAAVQGISLLISSGDTGDSSGVAGRATPQYPASNPWVTAVGGTSVGLDSRGQRVVETGWANTANRLSGGQWQPASPGPFAGGAGGGVSATYARPDYQAGVVKGTKRSVPDVAGLSDANTGIAIGTTVEGYGYQELKSGGTSAAAPGWAGLVADAVQAAGGERIGFLNPALYNLAKGDAIRDVKHQAAGVYAQRVIGYGGVPVPQDSDQFLIDFDAKPQSLQSGEGYDGLSGVGTSTEKTVDALAK